MIPRTAHFIAPLFLLTALSPTSRAADTPYAGQLAAECHSLISEAVRRPYGWAWPRWQEAQLRAGPTEVAMGPTDTPAAALVLLWSGRFLGQPSLIDASRDAARGVIASLEPTGKLRPAPIFTAATAGSRDVPARVPDRAPNCAALALMAAQVQDIESQLAAGGDGAADADAQDQLTRQARHFRLGADRAAHWLIVQETPSGAWPDELPPAPSTRPDRISVYGAAGEEGQRAICLDRPGYRDATIALILTAVVLKDHDLQGQARRPVDALLRLRIPTGATDGGLFPAVLSLKGDGEALPGYSFDPDAPASCTAMQTLMAAYVFLGEDRFGQALADAAAAMNDRRRPDGLWDRDLARPDQTASGDVPPASQPTTQATSQPSTGPAVVAAPAASFGLPPVLSAASAIKRLGRERFAARLPAPLDARLQVVAVLAGLSDEPLTMDWPASAADAQHWLDAHHEMFVPIHGPPPAELSARVRRLWLLYLRANLEREIAATQPAATSPAPR